MPRGTTTPGHLRITNPMTVHEAIISGLAEEIRDILPDWYRVDVDLLRYGNNGTLNNPGIMFAVRDQHNARSGQVRACPEHIRLTFEPITGLPGRVAFDFEYADPGFIDVLLHQVRIWLGLSGVQVQLHKQITAGADDRRS